MNSERLVAGRYRLEEPVGAGGMGSVWRATDLELGRTVALKRSHTGDGQQIRREARIGAGLTHPHVVTVHDVVVDGDDRWLVLEYVPSRRLDQVIGDGPLPTDEVRRIGADLAGALTTMHAGGVVHRDITPGNVLIAEDGTAKLTDLGIARWSAATVTGGAQIGGTAAYLAPEVAGGEEAGPPADVFALGATLFAAATGGSPWGSGDTGPFAQLRRAAAYQREPSAAAGELAPVLDAMLARRPQDRPTAGQARELLAGEMTAATHPWRQARFRRPRRRWVPVAAAAATVLVLAAVALVVALPHPSAAPAAAASPGTLGDPRTADPCALLVPGSLARFGKVTLEPNYGNFNHCDLDVDTSGKGDIVDVAAELASPDEYPSRPPTPGKLGQVQEDPPSDNKCQRTIPLPNLYRVVIFARQVEAKPAPLCGAAEAVALAAYGVLTQGPIPRRAAPFPAGSTALLDACTLLSGTDVAAALGKAAPAEPDYGHWTCYWENGPKQITVQFGREWPLEGDPPDGTTKTTTIGGHTAYLAPDSGECDVTLVHRKYTPAVPSEKGTPQQREETVVVSLENEDSSDGPKLCPATTALAAAVAARTPH